MSAPLLRFLLLASFVAFAGFACGDGIKCVCEGCTFGEGDLDGGKRHLDSGTADRTPRWTPDGQALVVNLGNSIVGVNVDGSALWRIPAEPVGFQFAPTVSLDGRVAYRNYEHRPRTGFGRKGTSQHRRHIEIANLDGTDVKRTAMPPDSSVYAPAWAPAWTASPSSFHPGRVFRRT